MSDPRPFVLIHGGWHDGSAWRRVVPLLEAEGHGVFTPSLTGHGDASHLLGPDVGLSTHVHDVVHLIESEDLTDVVMVGHSYGGMVISGVLHRVADRLAKVIYLDAMVPVHGESAVDVVPRTQGLIAAAARTSTPWQIPVPAIAPPPQGLAGVTDPADLAWLQPTLGPESVRIFTERVAMGTAVGDRVPRAHVHCVDFESAGATRRPVPASQPNGDPAEVYRLSSGHDCMVIVPHELATLLLRIGRPGRQPVRAAAAAS